MTAKTDLTWQEIQTELTAMNANYAGAISVVGGQVVIDVETITGETSTAMTAEGVVEFIYKLRDAAGRAQLTVNENQAVGEQLDSFPAFSYSAPTADGFVNVTQVSAFTIPLNTDIIKGPNV
ncbi:hypothetical protein H6G54_26785 [Anabaena cylindrica FACHB-243]|uniref:Uncharacterized protein n=1 Tax=Anabaena cylindrica (strain ATCC 27899 / PCC 7122) TaxID=272123 RepID=K9ZEL4_ANACC|nr:MULTISPECIES: hypothetical protein [Anabaena]AFZ57653.1 hypothetical protein Anacy_2189 [Anabaena cylindrica PCC 7122]AZL96670.1 hypothetical protein [Anabaena sp. CCAP 1446/1C]MBD2421223.1 hypothetical protein [Anabaena cylindrica FACHB-243]MBY5285738.1 hypothetical protein [Anabaena sp. CCAP 1446/1C]MBY5310509.1 hypothetical protein [Anabaena sp. CCAP 1446/1C]